MENNNKSDYEIIIKKVNFGSLLRIYKSNEVNNEKIWLGDIAINGQKIITFTSADGFEYNTTNGDIYIKKELAKECKMDIGNFNMSSFSSKLEGDLLKNELLHNKIEESLKRFKNDIEVDENVSADYPFLNKALSDNVFKPLANKLGIKWFEEEENNQQVEKEENNNEININNNNNNNLINSKNNINIKENLGAQGGNDDINNFNIIEKNKDIQDYKKLLNYNYRLENNGKELNDTEFEEYWELMEQEDKLRQKWDEYNEYNDCNLAKQLQEQEFRKVKLEYNDSMLKKIFDVGSKVHSVFNPNNESNNNEKEENNISLNKQNINEKNKNQDNYNLYSYLSYLSDEELAEFLKKDSKKENSLFRLNTEQEDFKDNFKNMFDNAKQKHEEENIKKQNENILSNINMTNYNSRNFLPKFSSSEIIIDKDNDNNYSKYEKSAKELFDNNNIDDEYIKENIKGMNEELEENENNNNYNMINNNNDNDINNNKLSEEEIKTKVREAFEELKNDNDIAKEQLHKYGNNSNIWYYEWNDGAIRVIYTSNDDKTTGYAIEKYSSGKKYEGFLKKDNRDGFGIYYYDKDGNEKYEGYWKDGKKDGFGTYYYPDGYIGFGIYAQGRVNFEVLYNSNNRTFNIYECQYTEQEGKVNSKSILLNNEANSPVEQLTTQLNNLQKKGNYSQEYISFVENKIKELKDKGEIIENNDINNNYNNIINNNINNNINSSINNNSNININNNEPSKEVKKQLRELFEKLKTDNDIKRGKWHKCGNNSNIRYCKFSNGAITVIYSPDNKITTGYAIEKYSSGNEYEGYLKDNSKEGFGTYCYYPSDNIGLCSFKNDLQQGFEVKYNNKAGNYEIHKYKDDKEVKKENFDIIKCNTSNELKQELEKLTQDKDYIQFVEREINRLKGEGKIMENNDINNNINDIEMKNNSNSELLKSKLNNLNNINNNINNNLNKKNEFEIIKVNFGGWKIALKNISTDNIFTINNDFSFGIYSSLTEDHKLGEEQKGRIPSSYPVFHYINASNEMEKESKKKNVENLCKKDTEIYDYLLFISKEIQKPKSKLLEVFNDKNKNKKFIDLMDSIQQEIEKDTGLKI